MRRQVRYQQNFCSLFKIIPVHVIMVISSLNTKMEIKGDHHEQNHLHFQQLIW
jgi:hypothetical protein